MARLISEQIMRENHSRDPASVSSLNLSLRSLSDVSCLSDFKNLERLDLSCNMISTLEGLGSCTNLKWLSVAKNKLESLKGIEGLPKLTVLNAAHNSLQSMDEVRSLTSLRALILNDNNLSAICKLDRLKYLNTLVLSRNPIYAIGDSLSNMKSVTKLSLSSCKIQTIGPSLISCVDLKELRFAGNEIASLPAELAQNTKLQNLDVGQNLITKWLELKVLSALPSLTNLNLHGNPVAETDNFCKKVKKLVPNLQILNSRPTEKVEKGRLGHASGDQSPQNPIDTEGKEKMKKKSRIDDTISEDTSNLGEDGHPSEDGVELSRDIKRKKPKMSENLFNKVISSVTKDNDSPFNVADIKPKKKEKEKGGKSGRVGESKSEGFDDGETSFMDLIFSENAFEDADMKQRELGPVPEVKSTGGLVVDSAKQKKRKKKKSKITQMSHSTLRLVTPTPDFGTGGPSAWDD